MRRRGHYLNHGEGGKKDEVDGSLLALDMEGDEEAHREEEGRKEHPGVALHCFFHPRGEEQHGTLDEKSMESTQSELNCTYYGGDGQLNCEQPIHLPHEPLTQSLNYYVLFPLLDFNTKSDMLAGPSNVVVVAEVGF